uniref:Bestrophin homolog n=1 Tax=Heterorhabditis bacteriophora TaxID=37862 RepID=A0A1I7XE18_HETBA
MQSFSVLSKSSEEEMTLAKFKFIWTMEYAHRMWGRAIGLNSESSVPRVSQYRLATHLSLAFVLYSIFLYNGISHLCKPTDYSNIQKLGMLRGLSHGTKALEHLWPVLMQVWYTIHGQSLLINGFRKTWELEVLCGKIFLKMMLPCSSYIGTYSRHIYIYIYIYIY